MAYIGNSAAEVDPVETENIGSLANLIMPELPGCDDLMVRQQLGYTLREFCRETDACVIDQPCPAKPTLHGDYMFPILGVPHGMVLGTVLDFSIRGASAAFRVFDTPVAHVVADGCVCVGDVARLRYSVYPKAGGEDCPAWFKERYAEAIVAGAMHKFLSMAKKPWSDPQRATEYGMQYANAINDASYRRLGAATDGGSESAIPCGGIFM